MKEGGPNGWTPLVPFLGHRALMVIQDGGNKCQREVDLSSNFQSLKIFLDTRSIVYLAQERERGGGTNEI